MSKTFIKQAIKHLESSEKLPELFQAVECYVNGMDDILDASDPEPENKVLKNQINAYTTAIKERCIRTLNAQDLFQDDVKPIWIIYQYLRDNNFYSAKSEQIDFINLVYKKMDYNFTENSLYNDIEDEWAYVSPIFGQPSLESQGKPKRVKKMVKPYAIKLETNETQNTVNLDSSGRRTLGLKGGTLSLKSRTKK